MAFAVVEFLFVVVVYVVVFGIRIGIGISSYVKEHVSLTGDGFNFLAANVWLNASSLSSYAPAVIAGEIAGDGGVMAGVGGLAVVRDARGEVVGERGG